MSYYKRFEPTETLTYKDTEVYKNTLTLVRLVLTQIVTGVYKDDFATLVFLCDGDKNRKYIRELFDETIRNIPLWLGCEVKHSSLRNIDFTSGFKLIFDLDPAHLKGRSYHNVFYIGSQKNLKYSKNL